MPLAGRFLASLPSLSPLMMPVLVSSLTLLYRPDGSMQCQAAVRRWLLALFAAGEPCASLLYDLVQRLPSDTSRAPDISEVVAHVRSHYRAAA